MIRKQKRHLTTVFLLSASVVLFDVIVSQQHPRLQQVAGSLPDSADGNIAAVQANSQSGLHKDKLKETVKADTEPRQQLTTD